MTNTWYVENGPQGDVVLSSRVRLARNLDSYPFPCRLSSEGMQRVSGAVIQAFSDFSGCRFHLVNMAEISPCHAVSLAERHLITPEFTDTAPGKYLLLSENESLSIMLCESDHVRIQSMQSGFALDEAYGTAHQADAHLDQKVPYAFDETLGYLTQSLAELGTAMRASVMLHLPALSAKGEITRFASVVAKMGYSVRSAYGDGNMANGDMYMLSNQLTLGLSEKQALDNLKSITLQLATRERSAREELLQAGTLQEKIAGAYASLMQTQSITAAALTDQLSWVRLGAFDGSLPVRAETVNALIANMQPATLNAAYDEGMNSAARDVLRAKLVRERLSSDAAAKEPSAAE